MGKHVVEKVVEHPKRKPKSDKPDAEMTARLRTRKTKIEKAPREPSEKRKKIEEERRRTGKMEEEAGREDLARQWKFHQGRKKAMLNDIQRFGFVFLPPDMLLMKYLTLADDRDCFPYFPFEDETHVYKKHPRNLLAGKSVPCYFFTKDRPNEIQLNGDINGQWIPGLKTDIIEADNKKIGVKQEFEYCGEDSKSEYKITDYQLDPAPKEFRWRLCKVYKDESCAGADMVHSGPASMAMFHIFEDEPR